VRKTHQSSIFEEPARLLLSKHNPPWDCYAEVNKLFGWLAFPGRKLCNNRQRLEGGEEGRIIILEKKKQKKWRKLKKTVL
jgi:hypothetical protein